MSNCNNKCDSCKSSNQTKITQKGRNIKKEDIKNFLKNPILQKEDGSDLNNKCGHYSFGNIQRWQCDLCILEWVQAHEDDVVITTAEMFKKDNKAVTYRRITEALKDKIWKRKIK